ncbi:MAG: tRNA (cytidine(34)-2'-O)-methyltransferase [SAR324 cluster bacterium]|nr:tRNA (cytidine(34)-2'-O)-methyltransferase [SAR324 cluster bacterium]MBF0351118.1 tRNA (cytidine(34)-2'-O)-methyltransferase [SAR324 cluster bacterium]
MVEPQIPPNTGNIARLCAASRCHLILVGTLGFELTDRYLKRAGLDYWDYVSWEHQPDKELFLNSMNPAKIHLLTTHTTTPYTRMEVKESDYIFFGKETAGLPESWRLSHPERCFTIPMWEPNVRSLNLASAVSIVVYDALRQLNRF